MVLVAQLRECDQNDAAVVRGHLARIFADGLPPAVVAKKYQEAMYDKGYCYGGALEELTRSELMDDCGVLPGEAKLILRAIHERHVQIVTQASPPQQQKQQQPTKEALRPFPVVGASGYPAVRAFEAFSEGFEARVDLVVSEQTMQSVENPSGPLPVDYDEGGEDDRFLYRVLLNEAKLPDDTVALIPQEVRKKKAGLRVWRLLSAGVHTGSTEASLKVVRFVTKPTPVEPAQKAMMSTVYQHWEQAVAQLAAEGQPVCGLLQQDGLKQMVSHLPEVMKKWDNLDGADDGSEVSLAAYKALVTRMAAQYSSVANITAAYGAVTVLAAGVGNAMAAEEVPGARPEADMSKTPCRWWKSGTCWRAEKCRFMHTGKPGVSIRGGSRMKVACGLGRLRGLAGRAGSVRGSGSALRSSRGCLRGVAGKAKAKAATLDPYIAEQNDLWLANKVAGVSNAWEWLQRWLRGWCWLLCRSRR